MNRILTTHAGRLDGPPALRALLKASRSGAVDMEKAAVLVPAAIGDLVRRQKEAGLDIVGDGELGQLGYGMSYYGKRLSGMVARNVAPCEPRLMSLHTNAPIA